MSLFSRLFGKSPPPAIAVRPAQAPDPAVIRASSIAKLNDGGELRAMAGLSANAAAGPDRRAAQIRLAQLLDAGAIDFEQFRAQTGSLSAMLAVVARCQDASRLGIAMAAVQSPAELAQLVVDSPSSRVRQLAAERIDEPERLRRLLKQVRDKDKNVYKILKQKCDALNVADRKAAADAAEIETLCASIERHSLKAFDSHYAGTLHHLSGRWQALPASPGEAFERRAVAALARGRDVIEAHLRQLEQQAAQQAADQAARLAARDADEAEQQAAREAAQAANDVQSEQQRQAAAALELERVAVAERRAAEEQAWRKIGGLIRTANAALGDGNTQRAAGVRRAIAEKMQTAPVLPLFMTRQLEQLDEKLTDLKQWKEYAVAPKRVELIEEMESLIGSSEEPKRLSERIKSLQEDWRTIGKGIVADAPEEWERFHRASQAAYEPCRLYFEAQAKLRQENLQLRLALLERLSTFEAGQHELPMDWRLYSKVLREAPQEWRQYFPVEREAARAAQTQFDQSMQRLQGKLDAWYDANTGAKQALIDRARPLVGQEDGRAAIESVKALQAEWKTTGTARREQDQVLWSEFREVCDAVFQKRQQAFAEYTAGLEANKLKAVALCEEAERAAASSGSTLAEGAAKSSDWQAAFDALDEMPRAEARALRDRFERALDSCAERLAQQRVREAEESFTALFDAGQALNAYRFAATGGADAASRDDAKRAVEALIAGVEQWPKGGLQTVKEVLAEAETGEVFDALACEKALRVFCIRCEIQTETATPGEDGALRREFQVQRLMQTMGQGASADDGNWNALAIEWVRGGPVSPEVYAALRERFLRCWAKQPQRPGARRAVNQ